MDSNTSYSDRNLASILIAPHPAISLIATPFVCLHPFVSKYVTETKLSTEEYTAIAAPEAFHRHVI